MDSTKLPMGKCLVIHIHTISSRLVFDTVGGVNPMALTFLHLVMY